MSRARYVLALLALAACRSGASPSPGDVVAAPTTSSIAPVPLASSAPPIASTPTDADAGDDFFACATDGDCIATRPGGCCFTGRLVAVNKGAVDAYAKANPCDKPHPICPMIRVNETRVPRCDAAKHRCEMVAP